MYGHVLVPLDGSTFADRALPLAVGIVRRAGATLHLALVHTPMTVHASDVAPIQLMGDWEQQHRARETRFLEHRADQLTGHGLRVEHQLLEGDVGRELTRVAEAMDLVVIASHGRGGIERAWLGSVADELVRHIRPPVLVVRPDEERTEGNGPDRQDDGPADLSLEGDPTARVRHVLVATGGSEAAAAAADHAVALARLCDARITLLAVADFPGGLASPYIPHAAVMDREVAESREADAERYLTELADRYPDMEVETRVWRAFHPARGILDAVSELEPDLVAVGTHRRSVVGRVVLGSVADKVVRASPVPVLVGHAIGAGASVDEA